MNLDTAIRSCIDNGRRLLDDVQMLMALERYPTALAMGVIAQEEFARAFMYVLVEEGHIPWTTEIHRSLYSHECKQLAGVLVEWLIEMEERAWADIRTYIIKSEPESLTHDVAVAINILRHEKIERMRSGYASKDPEWNGLSRRISEGVRNRLKNRSIYVEVSRDGFVESHPSLISKELATQEIVRAQAYREFAEAAHGKQVLCRREYDHLKAVIGEVFEDLSKDSLTRRCS